MARPLTNAQRNERYRTLAPLRGMVRVTVWVPREADGEIKQLAAELRARHAPANTEEAARMPGTGGSHDERVS
jgi:hypothetical protein